MAEAKKLFDIAYDCRRIVEKLAAQTKKENFGLCGFCGIGSQHLYNMALQNGIKTSLIMGKYDGASHCWLQYRKYYVDITATQFGVEEKVHIVGVSNDLYEKNMVGQKAMNHLNNDLFDWFKEKQSYVQYKEELNKITRQLIKKEEMNYVWDYKKIVIR